MATIIGLLAGATFIIGGILLGGSLSAFIHLPSLAITLGGTIAATMIHHPLPRLTSVWAVMRNAFVSSDESVTVVIETLTSYAIRARQEGLLSLESEAATLSDPFLRKGLSLVVDGTDPQKVRSILEIDLTFLAERHKSGANLFETLASYAPAFGLVGSLIGLIHMLRTLDSPEKIGPAMSAALLTTFYGSAMANLLFLPLAGKLKERSAEEVLRKEVIIEGLLAIQGGESPSMIAEKLNSFLSPAQRTSKSERGEWEEG